MKKIAVTSLALALLMCACATKTSENDIVTTEATTPTTTPVETVETVEVVETVVTEPTEATEPTVEETIAPTEEEVMTYLGEFQLTAYCACSKCCGQYANGITATGTVATQGRTIAVDPRVIPYGTEVVINGHTYVAEDCGGAIKQNRIDVYFDDHYEALVFGIQYADVYIIRS